MNDLAGQKYNRLTAIKPLYSDKGGIRWLCKCDCGNEHTVICAYLRAGRIKSCGCLDREQLLKRNLTDNPMWRKEVREKNAKSMTGKFIGSDSPRWDSTITEEQRMNGRNFTGYGDWRKAVYKRDNYTCQQCGDDRGGNLVAHHKEAYNNNPDLRIEITNGITLCEDCHNDFHHVFGFGSNTTKQLYYYMLEMGGGRY